MATYPSYDFSDPSLDYNDVLITAQQMYSDLLHQGNGCCKSKSTLEVLCQADVFFQDIVITGDIGSETYNLDRWQEDIQGVYTILSSFFRLSANPDVSPTTVFPQEAIDDLIRGQQYLSNLQSEYLSYLKRGCSDCKPLSFECLKRLVRALEFKNNLDEYDDVAIKLLEKMLIIIGGYTLEVPPTVDAGSDQTQEVGTPVVFSANGTEGSSPIVGYLWTKVSGGTCTLTDADSSILTVTDFEQGEYVFKVTVTDENGLTGSDTVKLTAQEASIVGYWWLSNEGDPALTQSEIITKTPFNYLNGGSLTVPFTGVVFKRLNIAYGVGQPTKTKYVNANDPNDYGNIGGVSNLLGSAIVTGVYKQHNGNYLVNGNRTLIFST